MICAYKSSEWLRQTGVKKRREDQLSLPVIVSDNFSFFRWQQKNIVNDDIKQCQYRGSEGSVFICCFFYKPEIGIDNTAQQ